MEQNALLRLNRDPEMNLAALADRLGVNKSTVSRWSRGRIPAEWVGRVSQETGISRHDLRPDIFGPSPSKEKVA